MLIRRDRIPPAVLVLAAHPDHRFLADDVSIGGSDLPSIAGYRQVNRLALAPSLQGALGPFDACPLAVNAEAFEQALIVERIAALSARLLTEAVR